MDYYGKRLATASSDRIVKVFEITGEEQRHLADLSGHEGPVWQVSWSHPKFGSLLASCSYDRRVFVWREADHTSGQWSRIFEKTFESSVNAIEWAPHELGLHLLVGSADSRICVISYQDGQWSDQVIENAHPGGVNSVSWSPARSVQDPMRFVSGGCDNQAKIWTRSNGQWTEANTLKDAVIGMHSNWVRDVAWAPSLGLTTNTIASCAEDQSVILWKESPQGEWSASEKLRFDSKVWRVSWSTLGNLLAVSLGNNQVSLWKEGLDGKWKNLSTAEEK